MTLSASATNDDEVVESFRPQIETESSVAFALSVVVHLVAAVAVAFAPEPVEGQGLEQLADYYSVALAPEPERVEELEIAAIVPEEPEPIVEAPEPIVEEEPEPIVEEEPEPLVEDEPEPVVEEEVVLVEDDLDTEAESEASDESPILNEDNPVNVIVQETEEPDINLPAITTNQEPEPDESETLVAGREAGDTSEAGWEEGSEDGSPSGSIEQGDGLGGTSAEPSEQAALPDGVSLDDLQRLRERFDRRFASRVERVVRYTNDMRRQEVEGVVVVGVWFEADGTITRVEVVESSGHEILDAAAIEQVRSARLPDWDPQLAHIDERYREIPLNYLIDG